MGRTNFDVHVGTRRDQISEAVQKAVAKRNAAISSLGARAASLADAQAAVPRKEAVRAQAQEIRDAAEALDRRTREFEATHPLP